MDRWNSRNDDVLMEHRSKNQTVTVHDDDDNGDDCRNRPEMDTCDAITSTITAHNDDDNGEKIWNRPEMGTCDAPTPTVTAHNDDDNGGESRNRPEMGTCDAPTPTATNSTQPYSSESGISGITLTPQTLLISMPSLESGTGNELDDNSILAGSRFSSRSTSSVITMKYQYTIIEGVPYETLDDSSIAAIPKKE